MNIDSLSSNMPIAVFDSGLGGLTVLKKLIEMMPNENYVYIGDNANIPYGDKSKEEIINLTLKMTDFLVEQKCKMIIIACNTITACSYDILKQKYHIPVIEVISNAVIDALDKTKNNNISIMATEFTVNSNIYKNKIIEFNKQAKVTQTACKDLCPMIENDWYSYENRLEILKNYLENIDKNSDTLILGCTHYPHIINDIKKLLENDIKNSINNIIDPSYHTAISAKEYLKNNNLLSDNKIENSKTIIFSTEKSDKINKLINMLLPKDTYKNYSIKYVDL
ncbi:glutamate racemase [Brachyspira hyodysenteriae]|uniref:glutamate racemase n=1 Tax=Brachyspira hyodysenteriae TaxID=159 RepID=UPI00063DD191|nr:glutamate racemase [Brachyspira hyodysenteriae]KLI20796.1 glutamate racemase [Brachyspira hyodysenteriae]